MSIAYRGTTALITGASAGLGAEFATQFAARGADVVLVARRESRLRELADRLSRTHGVTASAIPLDLSLPDAVSRLRAATEERGLRVQTLVNNAGFGMKGAFADADAARVQEMVQVNVATLVGITREFLPDLVHAGTGALVNVASNAAYQPCPGMAVYGATKAFVLSFTEALAWENLSSGLTVLAVSPGATRTEFFDVVGESRFTRGRYQSPEDVVAGTLRRLDRTHTPPSFVSGTMNAISARLAGIVPRRWALAASGRVLR